MTEIKTLTVNGQAYSLADTWARDALKDLQIAAGAPAIVSQAARELVSVADASDRALTGLTLYGKTEQFTTTGKNLFDKNTASDGYGLGAAGSTYLAADKLTSAYVPVESGETYTFSKVNWYNYYDADKTVISQASTPTFTVPDGVVYIRFTAPLADKDTVQLERGSTATAYEPYTGGIPSPNPDYPQELVSVGDSGSVGVTVAGKNLLWFTPSASTVTQDGLTFENHADGRITVNGTATAGGWYFMRYHSALAGYFRLKKGSYTFSGTSTHAESGKIVMRFQSYPYAASMDWPLTAQAPQKTFTLTEDTSFLLGILYYEGAVIENQVFKPQIEVGSVATAYEPYTEQALAVSTPNGLPGIPVSSGGNYTDENGQQWICDEIDFARGVYVQRVRTRVFDGTESGWSFDSAGETKERAMISPDDALAAAVPMCNLFPGVNTADNSAAWGGTDAVITVDSNGVIRIYRPSVAVSSIVGLEQWKAFLAEQYAAGTPLTVMYALLTPIDTPLDADALAAYAAMHTNKPNTTVMNDAGAHMKLSYVADTKSYIDNKFTELQNAVLAAGANI